MRACWYERTGPASEVLQVGEIDPVSPTADEVMVEVVRSGVNTTDLKRRGGARGGMPFAKVVPHFDAAGRVVEVGAEVDAHKPGDKVWVWEGQYRKAFGTCAQFVTVPASRACPLNEPLSFADGASIGVPALTAAHALSIGGEVAGKTVLITGGAGAVGNFAIQLAKTQGARVITTVNGDRKAEDARLAGADAIINYRTDSIAEQVLELTDGQGVAHMVDVALGAHLADAHCYVARNGTIASYGLGTTDAPAFDFPKFMYRNISIHGVAIFDIPEARKLQALAAVVQLAASGKMVCRTDQVFPLEDTARAHERLESGDAIGSVQIDLTA